MAELLLVGSGSNIITKERESEIVRISVSTEIKLELSAPTPFIFILRPRNDLSQKVEREKFIIEPKVRVFEYSDGFGNRCQRLTAPPGEMIIISKAEVMTDKYVETFPDAQLDDIEDLPNETLTYLMPSRYCESERLEELAEEIAMYAPNGYSRVMRIHDWVRHYISYYPGSSSYPMSAIEVKDQGYGVCRDLAHLCIALCRAINIPARMAVGYLYKLEPMDLHAWFEAYIGGRWCTFDPVMPAPSGGRVITAYGRDATDVAIYTQFGPPVNYSSVVAEVELLKNPPKRRRKISPNNSGIR